MMADGVSKQAVLLVPGEDLAFSQSLKVRLVASGLYLPYIVSFDEQADPNLRAFFSHLILKAPTRIAFMIVDLDLGPEGHIGLLKVLQNAAGPDRENIANIPPILAVSGDEGRRTAALEQGAEAFLGKVAGIEAILAAAVALDESGTPVSAVAPPPKPGQEL